MNSFMRLFDIFLVLVLSMFLLIPMLVICILIKITSEGPCLHWSERIGRNNINFTMPKFRTMVVDAPNVSTEKLKNPENYITPLGYFLRKTSLDELPQLWSVFVGEMSFVGPRPALYNQENLIKLRTEKNIHILRPGITGWAQINGRDELCDEKKSQLDLEYLQKRSFIFDLRILIMTAQKVLFRENVIH